MEMTKDNLKKICRTDGLYGLPNLNDKIYLHYKGNILLLCDLYAEST